MEITSYRSFKKKMGIPHLFPICVVQKCKNCGKYFEVLGGSKPRRCLARPYPPTYCSRKCKGIYRKKHQLDKAERSSQWKGGRLRIKQGYIYIYQPSHPHSTTRGYVFEHRLVMEKKLGRYLKPNELVHHKNAVKDDNKEENLEILTQKTHLGKIKCPFCEKVFKLK